VGESKWLRKLVRIHLRAVSVVVVPASLGPPDTREGGPVPQLATGGHSRRPHGAEERAVPPAGIVVRFASTYDSGRFRSVSLKPETWMAVLLGLKVPCNYTYLDVHLHAPLLSG